MIAGSPRIFTNISRPADTVAITPILWPPRACAWQQAESMPPYSSALPDGDGLTLARELRGAGIGLPILILTARDTLEDKLSGFDAGADDYLVKPFALQEVEARLSALARRGAQRTDAGVARLGTLEYDAAAQEVRLAGVASRLPPKAVRLIAALLSPPNRVFSRRELEVAVWGREQESSDNLRSVLHTLRRTLNEDGSVEIVNVHGMGYKLVAR
jgi:DNA-binding response OmpR family regulator